MSCFAYQNRMERSSKIRFSWFQLQNEAAVVSLGIGSSYYFVCLSEYTRCENEIQIES